MHYQPVHHTIVALDVVASGGLDDRQLLKTRVDLRNILRSALAAQSMDFDALDCKDLGDGLRLLVPASIPPNLLLDPFILDLDGALTAHRSGGPEVSRIRLRVAVHHGLLHRDADDWVGAPLVLLTRLLDAAPVRHAIRAAPEANLVLVISQAIHDDVVRHGYGLDRDTYRRIMVREKETSAVAWLHVPGRADGVDPLEPSSPSRSAVVPGQHDDAVAGAFVGRATELEQLGTWLAEINRAPAAVLLSGDAGVGKSRLLERFTRSARDAGAYVLSGACIELKEGAIPYGPLVEALRLLVRQHGEEGTRSLAGPAWADLGGLISDFTGDFTAGESALLGSQLRVYGAVLRLLEHIGSFAPVVLVFEDVHWADPSTLDLIAYLTRAKTTERMMLVCSYRSGLDHGHPLRILLTEPEFTRRIHRVDLGGFTEPDLREFLATAGARADRDRIARYLELTDGNPYYLELLLAGGPADRLPESLTEIMRTQIDKLSDNATAVLRVAATAGRRVSDHVLATVSELDDASLDLALHECLNRQILVVNQMDDTYAFRQALLRQTMYQQMLPRQRRRLHAAMAEALQDDSAPSAVAELAYHWFNAERRLEALASAVRAGGTAVRTRAFQEAETQYRRALELWSAVPDPETVAGTSRERVLGAAADAARWAGHVAQAVEWAKAAIAELDQPADPARTGELYERLGSFQWEAGAVTESVAAYEAADSWLTGQPRTAVTARVAATLATAAVRAGRYAEGLERALAAIELARSVDSRAQEGRALNSAGLALTMLGRAPEGVPLLRESLQIAAEVDHLEDLFRAYGNLGLALETSGDLAGAVEVLMDGLGQTRALGLFHARQGGVLANNASAALSMLGRWDEAVALLDEVLLDRPVTESVYLRLTRAEIDVARGQFDSARRLLDDVRGQPNQDPRFVGPLYACLAEWAILQGDLATAQSATANGIDAIAKSENTLAILQLCAVGLRAAADARLVARSSARRSTMDEAGVRELVDRARATFREGTAAPEAGVLVSQCEAEWSRARASDTVAMWAGIASGWEVLNRPYPAAYARSREAEAALRAGRKQAAADALRLAHATAVSLDAVPLLRQVTALANSHRIDLAASPASAPEPPPPHPADEFLLTPRELEILEEVSEGSTNAAIGRKLRIAESTVSVHVSHILRKLNVQSRTEAAAIAIRLRFF